MEKEGNGKGQEMEMEGETTVCKLQHLITDAKPTQACKSV